MADHGQIIIKKKKGHGGHAHHGGSWKVAYADFVTAMMAFFMVMWIMGLSDQTKAQVQGYFNDPLGFTKAQPVSKNIFAMKSAPAPSTKMIKNKDQNNESGNVKKGDTTEEAKEAKQLVGKLKKVIEKTNDLKALLKYMDFKLTKEGIRIELVESTGNVFFESGSSEIRPGARKLIKKIAPILASTGRSMIIEGHTDAKPYAGKDYTNWELSTDRASSLRHMLYIAGVPNNRFKGVRGYADTELKNAANPFDVSNRRVTLLLPWDKPRDSVLDLPKSEIKKSQQAEFKEKLAVKPPEVDVLEGHK